jgi:2',3'-cyclic-nucleotide 2'-phosphodiesterase (5'-nucleotidase family)
MKKYIYLSFVFALTACSCDESTIVNPSEGQKSIVLLFDNDVHCAIDGYARLAGLRDAIAASDTAWAAAVSSGDFLQGGMSGALSHGGYIVDVMRNVGYDAVTLGNHEFDYGVPRMKELLPKLNAPVVCSNFFAMGATQPSYAPYIIRSYGSRRVAFVGVTTPETMQDESYSFFDDEGNQLYDLRTDDVTQIVQTAVDDVRRQGADYVVLLSHLGEKQPALGLSSHDLVAATRGIDVVLDGHTHSVIEHDNVANLDGKLVPVAQTGTQFANVGKLVIAADGRITPTLIATDDIPYMSTRVGATIDSVSQEVSAVALRQIAATEFALTINDADGNRLVRRGVTNLADLVTDAFRHAMQAEIGLSNGGGIRANILAGDISYGDLINVMPFDNHMAKIAATGAQIVAMLERCTAALPEEDGQFPQVSGLRYTVHQKSHTVSDVQVLAGDTWQPLDPGRTYTIATTDYYRGGGFYDTLKDCTLVSLDTLLYRDAMADYLQTTLGGTVPAAYATSQGRITVVDD